MSVGPLLHYRASDVAVSGCFVGIQSLDQLIKAIAAFGRWAKEKTPLDDSAEAKGKGDAFEVFCEFLFRRNGLDGKLGRIAEFHLAIEDQQGVDAYGVNDSQQNVAMQFKFMSDPTEVIPDERMQYFAIAAQTKFHVDLNNDHALIIVTTGSNVGWAYEAQFHGRRRALFVINRNDLKRILINNPGFWEEFEFSLSVSVRTVSKQVHELFPHQVRAKDVINVEFLPMSIGRGQVIIPTAGGKTRLEAEAAWQTFDNGGSIVLLCVPRLGLGRQLLQDFYLNKPADLPLEIIPVASGQIELAGDKATPEDTKYNPTTIVTELKKRIANALNADRRVLLVSTYHSAERAGSALLGLERFEGKVQEIDNEVGPVGEPLWADLGVADEAHNVVIGQFHNFLDDACLPLKRRLFFTATRKTTFSESGKGMNNSAKFGEVLFHVKPIELIEQGIIVPPKLHILDYDGYGDYASDELGHDLHEMTKINLSMTIVGVRSHLEKTQRDGRIVVFCQSAEEAATFCTKGSKENDILRLWIDEDVDFFCITSDHGNFHPTDPEASRDKILADFATARKAVFFHYNIVSEGIDIPTVTGVLFLRGVDRIMTIQATGRALRLHNDDRAALREHRIRAWTKDVTDTSWTEGWKKPYGWVLIPRMRSINFDDASSLMSIVASLTDYGFEFDSRAVEHQEIIIHGDNEAEDVRDTMQIAQDSLFNFEQIRSMVEEIRQEEIELMIRPKAFQPVDDEGISAEPDVEQAGG